MSDRVFVGSSIAAVLRSVDRSYRKTDATIFSGKIAPTVYGVCTCTSVCNLKSYTASISESHENLMVIVIPSALVASILPEKFLYMYKIIPIIATILLHVIIYSSHTD